MGWLVAGALATVVVRLRLRLELVARAEHELRGPLTAVALAATAARRTPAGRRIAESLESELARANAALADLTAARCGRGAEPAAARPVALERLVRSAVLAWGRRRAVRLHWHAGPVRARSESGAVAQAIGNVLSNAVEHGTGMVEVRARREGEDVRIEVVNPTGRDRGRGLRIAQRSAARAGGALDFRTAGGSARAELVLPVER